MTKIAGHTTFQSTHPVWGGTNSRKNPNREHVISIHPPRVGWDRTSSDILAISLHFNPPTPCGVGLVKLVSNSNITTFQSTHPVWGGTFVTLCFFSELLLFQSTHPVWGGTQTKRAGQPAGQISIHPPRVGWDVSIQFSGADSGYFNPPTPCGVGHSSPS